jgi:hypothetical protein
MNREDSNLEQGKTEEIAENLKYMRSAVEKTDTSGEPDWLSMSVVMMWGLICLAGYVSIHFLGRSPQYFKWIWPVFYSIAIIGACYTFIGFFFVFRKDRKIGFVQELTKQVIWIWVIILMNGLVWTVLGKYVNNFFFGEPGFIFAMLFGLCLSVTGILDSNKWFLGAIIIFTGMVLAHFLMSYSYIVLGVATGAGLITAPIIEKLTYKEEK